MIKSNLRICLCLATTLLLAACSVSYKFNGASIDYNKTKTIQINDFPIRDHRTILHVRRRRWKDDDGKSYSKDWQLVARGTHNSHPYSDNCWNSPVVHSLKKKK